MMNFNKSERKSSSNNSNNSNGNSNNSNNNTKNGERNQIRNNISSDGRRAPRSLLRDRPLAEPISHRHRHISVGMNTKGGDSLQSIATATITTQTQTQSSMDTTTRSSIKSTFHAKYVSTTENDLLSRHSSASSERMSSALWKINESDSDNSDCNCDTNANTNANIDYRRRDLSDKSQHLVHTGPNQNQVPPVTFISDNSSVDSFPDFGGQQSSSSSCSTEYEFLENDSFDPFDNYVTGTGSTSASTSTNANANASTHMQGIAKPSHNPNLQQQQDFLPQIHSHSSSSTVPSNKNSNINGNNTSRRRPLKSLSREAETSSSSVSLEGPVQQQQQRRRRPLNVSSSLQFLSTLGQQNAHSQPSLHRSSSVPSSVCNPDTHHHHHNDGQSSSASTTCTASSSSLSSSSSSRSPTLTTQKKFRLQQQNHAGSSRARLGRRATTPLKAKQQQQQQQQLHQKTKHCYSLRRTVVTTGKRLFYSGGVILQLLVLVFIALLVFWSRFQASEATEALSKLRKAESLDLLRLHRLEDHSIHVHELLQKGLVRLKNNEKKAMGGGDATNTIDDLVDNENDNDDNNKKKRRRDLEETEGDSSWSSAKDDDDGDNDNDNDNDNDPLIIQYRQLRTMSAQLRKHEAVVKLQHNLQEKAASMIVESYGEGPVKVVIELNFDDDAESIRGRGFGRALGGDVSAVTVSPPPRRGSSSSNHQLHNIRNRSRNNSNNNRKLHDPMATGTYLAVVLWPDAPHAAWAWLEQIQRGVWNGASLEWDSSSTLLLFRPVIDDPAGRGHLRFVEHHDTQDGWDPDLQHGAWTIGLREVLIYDDDDKNNNNKQHNAGDNSLRHGSSYYKNHCKSRLEMFVNLADNQEQRKHETCIGKIFDGFGTLQRLLEATRLTEEGTAVTSATVKAVTAKHMTNQELEAVYS